jgi:hypothetical protein
MQNSVFQTVLAGVTVFVARHILLKLLSIPSNNSKGLWVIYRRPSPTRRPGTVCAQFAREAFDKLGHLSVQLAAEVRVVLVYSFTKWLFFLPDHASVRLFTLPPQISE